MNTNINEPTNTQPSSWTLWERIEEVQAAEPSRDLLMAVTEGLVELALTVDPANTYDGKDEGAMPCAEEIHSTLAQVIYTVGQSEYQNIHFVAIEDASHNREGGGGEGG